MEERRLLVAVALSLVVLTGYSLLFAPAPQPVEPKASTSAAGKATQPPLPGPEAPPASVSGAVEGATEGATPAAAVADERERRVEVVGPDFVVAFSNKGARLVSWTLSRHLDARRRPEEMVAAQSVAVRPLDVETGDRAVDELLRTALFRPSAEQVQLGSGESALRFDFSDGRTTAEKTIRFRGTGLAVVEVAVRRDGQALPVRLLWGPGIGNPTPEERDVRGYTEPQGVALVGGAVELLPPAGLPAGGRALSGVRWVGVESLYFAALMIPSSGIAAAEVRPVALAAHGEEAAVTAAVAAVDASGPVQLFVGAKDHERMAALGHQLERVVQVGDWIGPIVLVLMRLLRWVQTHVGNWGWSIVLLTVLINLVMAPFRHYSIVNGLKMAKISPEMRAIQERYRKVPMMDPRRQQMQEEINALYGRHGMSMSSQMTVGCLPMLLTMPFLFAFYRVLTVAVELRGAPFLWISDLAQKDPLFVTPVLMGVSMFAMQKMTPSAMDPAQQRIMLMMPLMLTFMFLWAPAGLNLYWLTSNVWSIAQQWVEMNVLAKGGARKEKRSK